MNDPQETSQEEPTNLLILLFFKLQLRTINFFYEFLERILQIYDGKKEILVDTYIAFSVNIWRICSSNARNCSCTFHLYNLLE